MAGMFYSGWYPQQWLPLRELFRVGGHAVLARHLRYASRMSRKLSRALFHAMVRHGPKLEREQLLLGRFVDIGTELFAITATCLRAEQLLRPTGNGTNAKDLLSLVDYFFRTSRIRIERGFRGISRNVDRGGYRLAQQVLGGGLMTLESGIVQERRQS